MPMAANEGLKARSLALRPQVAGSACLAAMLLLLVPLLTLDADARGGGGFGGHGGGFGGHGGGFGGHVGFAGRGGGIGFAGRGAGFSGARSFGAPRIGGASFGNRSLGVGRIGGAHIVGPALPGRGFVGRSLSGPRLGLAPGRFAGTRLATGSVRPLAAPGLRSAALGRGAFGHRPIANAAWQTRFASARFHGRFFGSRWSPWWRGGLVVGWIGPLFWPYVDYDFFDYVFWPYAYDDFWPYAYDDVYYGIYGAYSFIRPAISSAPRAGSSTAHRAARKENKQRRAADVCSDDGAQLADWPIERISEVVQPTDAQRPSLEELRAASAKAIDILKAGCPKDLPSIPTGRLAAMESRLQIMLAAVQTVRPALERFYQLLNDEQKARFNAVAPGDDPDAVAKDRRDLTKFCDEKTPGVTDLPIARIDQAVQPTPTQRAALDELQDASLEAAQGLKVNCPGYQTLTPTGRVEAMEKRLQATLGAVRTVQPALAKFYDSLSDEQKARFNSLRSVSRPMG